jgi:Icc protein
MKQKASPRWIKIIGIAAAIVTITVMSGCSQNTPSQQTSPGVSAPNQGGPTTGSAQGAGTSPAAPATGTGPTPGMNTPAQLGKEQPPAAPAQVTPDKPFRFAVMGDSRGSSNGLNEATIRSLMEKVKKLSPQPQFILFTGDQVSGGSDVAKQLAAWKNVVDDYFPMTSVFPALGNHEHNEKIFSDTFSALPKEQLPGYGKTAYYFDYGNARFITLNSDRTNAKGSYIIEKDQLDWLENLLKTSGKKQQFVQFHAPAYPIGAHVGSSLDTDPASRDALWAVLDKYNVTAVLVGHEHNYNRRKVDANFDANGHHFANTIYQLTIGGAGAPLYTGSKENKQVVTGPKASYHYMIVDVDGGSTKFTAYDLQQNEIDSFTVER